MRSQRPRSNEKMISLRTIFLIADCDVFAQRPDRFGRELCAFNISGDLRRQTRRTRAFGVEGTLWLQRAHYGCKTGLQKLTDASEFKTTSPIDKHQTTHSHTSTALAPNTTERFFCAFAACLISASVFFRIAMHTSACRSASAI